MSPTFKLSAALKSQRVHHRRRIPMASPSVRRRRSPLV